MDAGCCRSPALMMSHLLNRSVYLMGVTRLWGKGGELGSVEWGNGCSFNPSYVCRNHPYGGRKRRDHINRRPVFHRTETHALPHSSDSHNWKHLGMKIESRWHINGRVLQGHADKKRRLLLTRRVHDRVTGPPQRDGRLGVGSHINSYSRSAAWRLVVRFTPSGAHP